MRSTRSIHTLSAQPTRRRALLGTALAAASVSMAPARAQPTAPTTTSAATSAANATARPFTPALLSPRMRQLQADLKAGHGTDSFWRHAATHGTPLVEPGSNASEQLLTFLWRGASASTGPEGTRSVSVSWAMRSPDGFALEQLPGSDVWFLTLRVPAGLHASYQLVPNANIPAGADRMARARAEDAVACADPMNPLRWPHRPQRDLVGTEPWVERSALRLPGAPAGPWADAGAPAAQGSVTHWRHTAQRLTGPARERDVSLYLPAAAQRLAPGTLPLVVVFDREAYLDRVDLPAKLDALIAQQRMAPLAALFVGNPTRALRATELPCDPDFADYLALELLPWAQRQWPVLTTQAAHRVVTGSSYGGLASAWAAFRHPGVFGQVLALSGSFWWGPTNVPHLPGFEHFGEGEWLTREFARAPRKPVRFFITAGLMEIALTGDGGGILDTSRHLRTVLQAKGYDVRYQEFAGGHDHYAWGDELARGLIALLGGRQQTPSHR